MRYVPVWYLTVAGFTRNLSSKALSGLDAGGALSTKRLSRCRAAEAAEIAEDRLTIEAHMSAVGVLAGKVRVLPAGKLDPGPAD